MKKQELWREYLKLYEIYDNCNKELDKELIKNLEKRIDKIEMELNKYAKGLRNE